MLSPKGNEIMLLRGKVIDFEIFTKQLYKPFAHTRNCPLIGLIVQSLKNLFFNIVIKLALYCPFLKQIR